MIVTPAMQHEYQIEKLIDLLVEAEDLEWQYVPGEAYDRLRQDAIEVLDAEEKGDTVLFDMAVVEEQREAFPTDTGRWRYRALLAKDVPEGKGCREHRAIDAASLKWASVAAVQEHERRCVGRG